MEDANSSRSPLRISLIFLFVVVFPLSVGLYLAPRIVPKPQIGVIRLSYDISSETAPEITKQLDYARNDPTVRAVVLVINSPGGSAAYSEELYLDVLHTREIMPIIASVDVIAASGAYYMATAADAIYAKPTSSVGSVGVIFPMPGEAYIEEDVLTTGPYKAFGFTRDAAMRQIERAKFAFLEAIKVGRGDALNISPDVLSRAEVYTGVQALSFGLVDGVLSTDEAVQQAASLAGLSDYDVVELYPLALGENNDNSIAAYQPPPLDVGRLWAPPTNLPPGIYYRYIPTNH